MVDKLETIWMDGEMVDWDKAKVHILTHSLHYGVAAFEGIRAYKRTGGASGEGAGCHVFRLHDHVDRLFDSCKMALIPPKFTREQIVAACVEVLRKNHLQEGYIRPVVYVGEGAMGIYAPDNPVRSAVMAWKWGAYLGKESLAKGIRCKISAFARHHVNVGLANIFIVKRGTILTPDLSSSILEGITRDTIIQLAREEGIPLVEGRVTRDQLWLADEAFFTGTAAEVTPIREVDDRLVGDGTVGPITKRLQARFFDVVSGRDTSHPEWLTKV
jgi:branched-chain amino acid aminotransferase